MYRKGNQDIIERQTTHRREKAEAENVKIALVDNEREQLDKLSEMIERELAAIGYSDCETDTFDSGEAFLAGWHRGTYDIILLDIFMDRQSGVEVARRIRESDEEVRLVFCTTSNEFASESYEVNAQYYLQKPVEPSGISAMLRRLNLEQMDRTRAITLPDGHPVILRNILYTDYSNHVITFYMEREEVYRIRLSQSQLEELLLPWGFFFSPIKGMIVNFHGVERMTEDSFILHNDMVIPIARRKYKETKEAYTRFRFEKLKKEVSR